MTQPKPDVRMQTLEAVKDQLPRWAYSVLKRSYQDEDEVKKQAGTTAEERAASGLHFHHFEPGTEDTLKDGAHFHAFKFPNGQIVMTALDGAHTHSIRGKGDVPSGAHTHNVLLPPAQKKLFNIDEMETKPGGHHIHEALADRTTLSGVHSHDLELPGGEVIRSLMPADLRAEAEALRDKTGTAKVAKAEPIPPTGLPNADVLFVGGAPDKVEWARREPLVGMCGDMLQKKYIAPLGLDRSRVARINAYPVLLKAADGAARQPEKDELGEWREWLLKKVDMLNPRVVIALGWAAKEALGDAADVVVPHPNAIRKHWDSGEIARKLKRVDKLIKDHEGLFRERGRIIKAGLEESNGSSHWEKQWHKMLPVNGRGKFILQNHFTGLDAEQKDQSNDALMQGASTVHGDLRLEGPLGAWGWTVLIGATEDNRGRAQGNRLVDLEPEEELQMVPKMPHDSAWMDVGKRNPKVILPGRSGSGGADQYGKFFKVDLGTYTLGVVKQHSVELFLDGAVLKGRYLLTAKPVDGKRIWLIDKPSSQRPSAETENLDAEVEDLRSKGQRFLFWNAPGQRPQKINVRSGAVTKSQSVEIWKADAEQRIVYGVVLDPYQVDAHGDWISPKEIEQTAHNWFRKSRVISLDHKGLAEAEAVESWVEQYPTRQDYLKAMRGEAHSAFRREFGGDTVHSGAWILGTKLSPELWAAFERGELQAYSIEGFAQRRPISPIEMPPVNFVELVEARKGPPDAS